MADSSSTSSIQESFQRINLSPDDLASAISATGAAATTTIPILQRSLDAKSKSIKLREVSPVCVLVVGMAGSGKTTLMAALQRSLSIPESCSEGSGVSGAGADNKTTGHEGGDDGGDDQAVNFEEGGRDKGEQGDEEELKNYKKPVGYCLNLDPATKLVPFGASIDIRDTVDYKEVMKQHKLGPNGAIMTSLNLFSTKFDQVMSILENRAYGEINDKHDVEGGSESNTLNTKNNSINSNNTLPYKKALDYILVDTPGQIEAFTWSASGTIITSALSSAFPTVLAFVVDTPRCVASLNTFMSNMLYACSMFYRTRLPLVIVFNKSDVVGSEVCMEWMDSYDKFQEALDDFMSTEGGQGYYASLTRSLSLVLDEFYTTLDRVGVSAATGDGIEQFWNVVEKAADSFDEDYVSDLQCKVDEQNAKKRALARGSLRRMQKDLATEES